MKKLLPRVKAVLVKEPYKLILTFTTNETKIYDMGPFLHDHPKCKLNDVSLFKNAYVAFGTVEWNDDFSLCPDSLYLDSQLVSRE